MEVRVRGRVARPPSLTAIFTLKDPTHMIFRSLVDGRAFASRLAFAAQIRSRGFLLPHAGLDRRQSRRGDR